ncbi:TPA: DUF3696 domain-containing protein [Serratia fonticola]
MLKNLYLNSFKSILNSDVINLSGYSLLCGANSCGKSSVIQSLLMLSQTFSARFFQDSVCLNGPLVKLGSFPDIISHGSKSGEIRVGLTLNRSDFNSDFDDFDQIELDFSFDKDDKNLIHPGLIRSCIKIKKHSDDLPLEFRIIRRVENSDSVNTEAKYDVISIPKELRAEIERKHPGFNIIGCKKRNVIPTTLIIEYEQSIKMDPRVFEFLYNEKLFKMTFRKSIILKEKLPTIPQSVLINVKKLIHEQFHFNFLNVRVPEAIKKMLSERAIDEKEVLDVMISGQRKMVEIAFPPYLLGKKYLSFNDWHAHLNSIDEKLRDMIVDLVKRNIDELIKSWQESSDKERKTYDYELKPFLLAARYMEGFFTSKFKYLGPLRNEPQAIYPSLGLVDPTDVGLKGQYSAAVLHINKEKDIVFPDPLQFSDSMFLKDDGFKKNKGKLLSASLQWLHYLGVVDNIETYDKGKFGYELNVKTSGDNAWQDLTHVGVGVSQVLPIVLMSLLSEEGDVLIFEQPELHLHPKVQTRLSDFFIAMSLSGRQCIVETHSEYMINRLRLRIAQSEDDRIKKSSSVLFVQKDDGQTDFRQIDITKYGSISDWPQDFFDQTQNEVETILLEGTRKRRMERASK